MAIPTSLTYQSQGGIDLEALRLETEPGVTLMLKSASYVTVNFDAAQVNAAAMDAAMASMGFLPAPPGVVDGLFLVAPNMAKWALRSENDGRVVTQLEGSAGILPVSERGWFVELAVDASTASPVFVDLIPGGLPIVTTGGPVLVELAVSGSSAIAGAEIEFVVTIDGMPTRGTAINAAALGLASSAAMRTKVPLAAGAHIVKIEWRTSAGLAQVRPVTAPDSESASLYVRELVS